MGTGQGLPAEGEAAGTELAGKCRYQDVRMSRAWYGSCWKFNISFAFFKEQSVHFNTLGLGEKLLAYIDPILIVYVPVSISTVVMVLTSLE